MQRTLVLAAVFVMAGLALARPATAGTWTISPTTYDTGNIQVGLFWEDEMAFTVTNHGTPTFIDSIQLGSDCGDHTTVDSPDVGIHIGDGESIFVRVFFAPPTRGQFTCTATIIDDNADNDVLRVRGRGVSAELSVNTHNLAFGNVDVSNGSRTMSFQIQNTSNDPNDSNRLESFSVVVTAGGSDFTLGTLPSPPINQNSSKTVQVTFNPTAQGSRTGTIRVTSLSDHVDQDEEIALTGTGTISTITLTASPTSINFGQVPVGQNATRTVTVQNTGNADGTITALSTGNSRFTASPHSGSLPLTVPAGDSVNLDVRFTPQNGSVQNATLTIDGNGSTDPTVSLTGDGQTVDLSVSTTSVDFGDVAVGGMATRNVTLHNGGEATIRIVSVSVDNTTDFAIRGIPANTDIAGGDDRTFQVDARPQAGGVQSGTVRVDSDLVSDRTVSVRANGVTDDIVFEGNLSFPDTDVDAGPAHKMVGVRNRGGAARTFTGCAVTGNSAFSRGSTPACPVTIQPDAVVMFDVIFDPATETEEDVTGTLTLSGNGAAKTLGISGRGIDQHIALSTTSVTFPDTFRNPRMPATQMVRIRNTGAATLNLSSVTVTGAGFALVGNPPTSVAGNGMVDVTIAFRPTSVAMFSGMLRIASDDDGHPTMMASLSGRGIARPATVSRLTADFGEATTGEQVRLSDLQAGEIVVHNGHTAAFTVTAVVTEGAEFFASLLPANATVAAGADLRLDAAFQAADAGDYDGKLAIYLDGDPIAHAIVMLRGSAAGPPTDAALPVPDAGPDGGLGEDGGPGEDGSVGPDSGTEPPDADVGNPDETDRGTYYTCSSGGGGGAAAPLVGLLALGLRRRRRVTPRSA